MSADTYHTEVVDPGDRLSQLAKQVNRASYGNCPAVHVVADDPENFRGSVGWIWDQPILERMFHTTHYENLPDGRRRVRYWEIREDIEADGQGGKGGFFTLLGRRLSFRQLAWEIIAMNADDFVRSGRFPAILVNNMDIKRVTPENYEYAASVIKGLGDACAASGLVSLTGETAIMKYSVTAFCDNDRDDQLIVNWGAACIGLADRDKMIRPKEDIKPGMPVVGFWEPGYRCNGGTFFTNIIIYKWGFNPQGILHSDDARDFVERLVVPSQSYARTIRRLHGWDDNGGVRDPIVRFYGIAHITGGGVWSKFGEMMPVGVGAVLNSMPEPAEVLRLGQEYSVGSRHELSDWKAYGTLHGGCGMLIVCHPDDVDTLISEAGVDGIRAMVVGQTVASNDSEIIIHSRFRERDKKLSSLRPE